MKSKGQFIWVLLAVTALSTCNLMGQSENNEAAKAIKKRVEQLIVDYNEGNGEDFADVFSEKFYPAAQKQAIKLNVEQVHQIYEVDYSIKLEKIAADSKMGYEKGVFTLKLIPKAGGDEVVQRWEFLDIWELEADGKWRITNAVKFQLDQ